MTNRISVVTPSEAKDRIFDLFGTINEKDIAIVNATDLHADNTAKSTISLSDVKDFKNRITQGLQRNLATDDIAMIKPTPEFNVSLGTVESLKQRLDFLGMDLSNIAVVSKQELAMQTENANVIGMKKKLK